MQHRASLTVLIGIAMAGVLAGCAAGGGAGAGAAPSAPPSAASTAPAAPSIADPVAADDEDPVAAAEAEAWLAAAVMPAGAVRSETDPGTAPTLALVSEGWWCEGTVERRAWWSIPDRSVVEVANWLREHPAEGLIVPPAFVGALEEDPSLDGASVAHLPEVGALEGLVLRVAKAEDGAVVRGTAGAHPGPESCPTPPPGTGLGGPGEG